MWFYSGCDLNLALGKSRGLRYGRGSNFNTASASDRGVLFFQFSSCLLSFMSSFIVILITIIIINVLIAIVINVIIIIDIIFTAIITINMILIILIC